MDAKGGTTTADPRRLEYQREILQQLLQCLELRVPFMRGRGDRIAAACRFIAAAMNLPRDDLAVLVLAARFHDIGLLAAPDGLLTKTGPLKADERSAVDRHTDLGARLLAKVIPVVPGAVEAVCWHHERPDGKGPHQLGGREIPILAGILALVGAVESMANGRPHRPALPLADVKAEIQRNSGTQFATRVVAAFNQVAEYVYTATLAQPPAKHVEPKPANEPTPPTQPAQTPTAPVRPSPAVPTAISLEAAIRELHDMAPLVKDQELAELIQKGLEFKPLAPSVQQVLALASSPRCTTDEVAGAVAADPVISVRLLRMANSSIYGAGHPIQDVKTAVQRVGRQELRNLVAALGVVQRYEGINSANIDVRQFWEHAAACGLAAREIGTACQAARRDDYFLWGVLHDVGRLVLLENIPKQYDRVLETASRLGLPVERVEQKLIRKDHTAVAKLALQHWAFPSDFVLPVSSHHESPVTMRRLNRDDLQAAASIALANRLVHALLLGCSGNDTIYPLDEFVELLKLDPALLPGLVKRVMDETGNLRVAVLVRDSSDRWPDYLTAVAARLARPLRPLCVSREPEVDAYRLLLTRLADSAASEAPNVGVIYVRNAVEQAGLFTRYEACEREAHAKDLPVIVICAKEDANSASPWLKQRKHAVLYAPLRISTLLTAIHSLLD